MGTLPAGLKAYMAKRKSAVVNPKPKVAKKKKK